MSWGKSTPLHHVPLAVALTAAKAGVSPLPSGVSNNAKVKALRRAFPDLSTSAIRLALTTHNWNLAMAYQYIVQMIKATE